VFFANLSAYQIMQKQIMGIFSLTKAKAHKISELAKNTPYSRQEVMVVNVKVSK
jgi:hypothetical protein